MRRLHILLLLVVCSASLTFAQVTDRTAQPKRNLIPVYISHDVAESVASRKAELTPAEKKLQSSLVKIKEQFKRNGNTMKPKGQIKQSNDELTEITEAKIDDNENVYVYVSVPRGGNVTELRDNLRNAGFVIDAFNADFPKIQLWIPIARIDEVALVSGVGSIELITDPLKNTGPVNSRADTTLRSNISRSVMGITGSGVKVGVMSDDCGTTENLVAPRMVNGELGGSTIVLDDSWAGTRTHEGLAMMELVQDIAPAAQLYYATAFTGLTNFANNVVALKNAGCKVITDDIIYFGEPVFEDGPLSQTIDNVCTNDNVVYTSAIINFAQKNYYYNYTNLAAQNIGNTAGTHNVMDWDGAGDFLYNFTIGGSGSATFYLTWDDPYGASSNDFDLFIVNTANNTTVASSTNPQTGTQDPFEAVGVAGAGSARLIVRRTAVSGGDANATPRMRLLVRESTTIEYATTATSTFGHPTSAKALGCGAIDASAPGYTTIESFSSRGPTYIVDFSTPGTRPLTATRIKPDLACYDGVQTSVGGFQPFYGSSASAPNAAGVAALLLSAYPAMTGAQARQAILNGCSPLYGAAPDNTYGAGRLDAFRTIALARASQEPNLYGAKFTTALSAVADNNASGTNSNANIAASAGVCGSHTLKKAFVSILTNHTAAGQLNATLTSPGSLTRTLKTFNCAGSDDNNMNVVLADDGTEGSINTFNPTGDRDMIGYNTPSQTLNDAAGYKYSVAQGNWTLNLADRCAGQTGTLQEWGIFIEKANTPPVIPKLNITWTPPFLSPNDHGLDNIVVTNSFVPATGCSPTVVLQSITNNEPDAGTGGGDVASDIQGTTFATNDLAFQLRSECKPQSAGRWYTVTYRIADNDGYQRDTSFYIPVICDGGHFDPAANSGAAGVLLDAAPSPNPLTSTSSISYTIPAGGSAPVRLRVCNALGKWVKNLDYGTKAPGTYLINWAGTRADGVSLPNGVYIYQLSVGAPAVALKTGVVIINH